MKKLGFRYILLFSMCLNLISLSAVAGECTNINKIPICHKGAGVADDHKAVEICVDFGALWGHIAQHPQDQIGECAVDIEENLNVWACNAGLRHKDHSDRLCFDLNQGGLQVANCSQSDNCVCSGDSLPQRLNDFDFFSYEIADYFEGERVSSYVETDLTAGRVDYSQASDNQGMHILNNESGAQFKLGSERFGSEYFVDICWQILDPSLKDTALKVSVDLSLTADIFTSGNQGYLSRSQATQYSGVFCDKTTSSGEFDYFNQPVFSTAPTPFSGGTRSFNTVVSGARSCFARMMFKENQNSLLRPNELQQVTVHANLDLEPVDNRPPQDNGLTFCHVQRVRGNTFQCTTRSFPDTPSLRTYMTSGYNNIPDWRQDHNLDYRGECRSTCGPLTGAEGNQ